MGSNDKTSEARSAVEPQKEAKNTPITSYVLPYGSIPRVLLDEVARRFERGDKSRGPGNWRLGLNDPAYLRHRAEHAMDHLLNYIHGTGDETPTGNLAAVGWAVAVLLEAERLTTETLSKQVKSEEPAQMEGSRAIAADGRHSEERSMNTELLETVARRIETRGEPVDMRSWFNFCGTAGCIAGEALLASGEDFAQFEGLGGKVISARAAEVLGLGEDEAARLFLYGYWPDEFAWQGGGFAVPASTAAARIRHFVATQGAE